MSHPITEATLCCTIIGSGTSPRGLGLSGQIVHEVPFWDQLWSMLATTECTQPVIQRSGDWQRAWILQCRSKVTEGFACLKGTTCGFLESCSYRWAVKCLVTYHSILSKIRCSQKLKISFQLLLGVNKGHVLYRLSQTQCPCVLSARQMHFTCHSLKSWIRSGVL
jgi:hypothetical protein